MPISQGCPEDIWMKNRTFKLPMALLSLNIFICSSNINSLLFMAGTSDLHWYIILNHY